MDAFVVALRRVAMDLPQAEGPEAVQAIPEARCTAW